MRVRPTFDPMRTLLAELGRRRDVAAGGWPHPVLRRQPEPEPPPSRRTRLWELGSSLHCSIIGTCLSVAELRRALEKANLRQIGATEHELHGQGVTLAGTPGPGAKLLHKALDERHRLTIKRFERARTEDELRLEWQEARRRGDIPGAYWAVLSHPAATSVLVREIFGEVHMLSHLVGAANRADIRRLSELEAEKDALAAKVERQQTQLQRAVGERDARIAELTRLLAARPAGDRHPEAEDAGNTLAGLVVQLQRRLEREQGRRAAAEARLAEARAGLADETARREAAERSLRELQDELAAVEASLVGGEVEDFAPADDLAGTSLLYVGGHPGLVGHLRSASDRFGATLEHHDGGMEDRAGLLVGLIGRADLVLFPVDCVSHEAALAVKRLCRQAGKPYRPLRSAGLASFVTALRCYRAADTSSEAAVASHGRE